MLRKWKTRYILLSILIALFILLLIFMDSLSDKIEKYVKKSSMHNFIQDLSTEIVYNSEIKENLNKSKIYFVHIPRTASDSIRTHMIGKSTLLNDRSGFYCKRFEDCFLLSNDEFDKFQNYYIIKGFYSYNDLSKYKIFDNNHNIFITIFRHPIERILSLYEFSRHGFLFRSVTRSLTLKQFLTSEDPMIQSMINNSITWPLGFHLLISERKRFIKQQNTTINDNNVNDMIYNLAKSHLDLFDYIGFYENLMYDYNDLNSRIFSKLNRNHDLLDWLFNVGCWFGFFRMRVLKYNARIKHNNEIQTILNQLTFYDMKLYNFAKNEIRQLNFVMFDNYSQVSLVIWIILIDFIAIIFLLYLLKYKVICKFKMYGKSKALRV